jgi:exodeoxyribonuclease V alpha subunit
MSDNQKTNKPLTISGSISKIKFQRDGFYIFNLLKDEISKEVLKDYKYPGGNSKSHYFVCKGTSNYTLNVGDTVEVVGLIEINKISTYEPYTFAFQKIEKSYIFSEDGFVNSLKEYKGIGEKMAKKLFTLYDKDIGNSIRNFREDILSGKNEVLNNLLSEKIYESVKNAMLVVKEGELILSESESQFLKEMNISSSVASKIKKHNPKSNIIEIFEKNPYELALYVKGIGFKSADVNAKKVKEKLNLDIDIFRMSRLRAGIFYVLKKGEDSGHTYLREFGIKHYLHSELEFIQEELLGEEERKKNDWDFNEDMFSKAIADLIEKGFFIMEDINIITNTKIEDKKQYRYYLKHNYTNEINIANYIKKRMAIQKQNLKNKKDDSEIELEFDEGFIPSKPQESAIKMSFNSNIMVLTGGPGTGKTSIAKYIYRNLSKTQKVSLMAPTGTAAKRISSVIGCNASTIHRALKLGFGGKNAQKNKDGVDSFFDSDVVIIDEASMIDHQLAEAIFASLHPETVVIFIGDTDQLESVGAGNFLLSIMEIVPTTRLTDVYRQALDNPIVSFAYDVNGGDVNSYKKYVSYEYDDVNLDEKPLQIIIKKNYDKKFNEFASSNLESDIVEAGLSLYKRNDLLSAQILLPQKNGGIGSGNAINLKIQRFINDNPFIKNSAFKIGDKVIQTKNNYEKVVFNGDIGIIQNYNDHDKIMYVEFLDGSKKRMVQYKVFPSKDGLQKKDFDESAEHNLELSYCITIHKSQGQEFKEIILGLNSFILVNRKLFYTGLTRGKSYVKIFSNHIYISNGIKTESGKESVNGKLISIKRNSTLRDRLLAS